MGLLPAEVLRQQTPGTLAQIRARRDVQIRPLGSGTVPRRPTTAAVLDGLPTHDGILPSRGARAGRPRLAWSRARHLRPLAPPEQPKRSDG